MVILFPPRAQVAFQALGRQQRSFVLTGPGWELGAWWQRLGDRVGAELVGPWRKGVGCATRLPSSVSESDCGNPCDKLRNINRIDLYKGLAAFSDS